jgi:hypothetical protein
VARIAGRPWQNRHTGAVGSNPDIGAAPGSDIGADVATRSGA